MKTLKTMMIAALVAVGTITGIPTAYAQDVILRFGTSDPRLPPDADVDLYREGGSRRCTPERALDKAERMGFRRVDLERVGRNRIVVSGRRDGEWYDVVFARERGCPVIRIR